MADIKLIAEALVGLTSKEIKALTERLKEEYGIEVVYVLKKPDVNPQDLYPKPVLMQIRDKQVLVQVKDIIPQKRKMFVSKKIGKSCKPYVSRRK